MRSPDSDYILWLGARRAKVVHLLEALEDQGYRVVWASSGRQALALAEENPPALLVVHVASMGSSGRRLVQRLQQALPATPHLVVVNSHQTPTPQVAHGRVLREPLTQRRLLHAVRRYLLPPHEHTQWQEYGPILFDPVNRRVRCHDREHTLTPKLTRLLAYFLQHPNSIIPREELFQAVWGMPSNNDLRTLQVHICWLRRALEQDPRNPVLLRTVRGKGYMLVLPEPEASSVDQELAKAEPTPSEPSQEPKALPEPYGDST